MRRVIVVAIISTILLLLPGCRSTAQMAPTLLPTLNLPTSQPAATSTQYAAIIPTSTSTPTHTPCRETHGTILDIEIPTDLLNRPVSTKVYLPPCYDTDAATEYPVFYMLHGQAATNDQWVRLGLSGAADELINLGTIQPLIIVMPFEITWTPGPEDSNFDEALIGDVVPYIDANYATCAERGCRAVGGLSRGGNWAVYLGFAYPELFGVVGAHSTPLFYGEEMRISRALSEAALVDDLPYILIDMGSKDDDRAFVQAFRTFLEENGIPFDYHEFDGRHEESYWSAHVSDYLQWYSERLIIPGEA
jgi:enterochelin esterase-like enzyme